MILYPFLKIQPTKISYIALIIISIFLESCSNLGESTVNPAPQPSAAHYTVKSGDTLAAIARRLGLTYQALARLNQLEPPYLIYPGQVLRLTGDASEQPDPVGSERNHEFESVTLPSQWQWPLQHKQSPMRQAKGVLIPGVIGQPVMAVADGQVVYGGSGIVGYGNLLVIKHGRDYLSIYGHNRALLVAEGAQIRQGQVIAELGTDNAERAMLYFEVRKQGRPVDPLSLLPKQE